ncbi:hypothetical protein ACETRX_03975 [Labrys portucalensis]|uniref:Uncharacterized protein n=1 Tax=Labrys neptuniae TaxID=376174 RepID=A0ABV6Z9H6_9HYPH
MDLADHPFSVENIARESGASNFSERRWLRWCRQAELLLGHDLDGNDVDEAGCGYSLDEASNAFDRGLSPNDYVLNVILRPRYRGEFSKS